MATSESPPLETIVRSNEKLIKAMLALLSLKDEYFLDELKSIFAMAAQGGPLSTTDPKVWEDVHRKLALIEAIVAGDDGSDQDGNGDGNGNGNGNGHNGDGAGAH
ncbi:MAG: hypothetical protein BGN86_13150 [Caulobacterales bacterium 68-7]|nr:hypothetical protein [Caulobacterales bacterium]OJU11510.1 MAG: hypothetical protein BGN86_13150 [Caulobacterales bacterium 68-7]